MMKSTPNCQLQFLPLLVFSLLKAVATQESFNVTGFDIGPDWTKVTHFPPLTDDQGKPIDANNVRGTRLFGYEGCGKREENIINEAYKDFYTLTDQLVLWNNIGWKTQGAKEFWGATAGRAPIRDEQKVQIRREFPNIGYILRPRCNPPCNRNLLRGKSNLLDAVELGATMDPISWARSLDPCSLQWR